jgi:predicted transcriptional regulator
MRILGLFEGRESRSVSDVREGLVSQGTDLAYTTVMTVLSRLHAKGLLARKRDGKRYLYAPTRKAPEMTDGFVARIHRTLFKHARMRPIAALLDQDDLSTEELRALRKLVDEKLKDRQG